MPFSNICMAIREFEYQNETGNIIRKRQKKSIGKERLFVKNKKKKKKWKGNISGK